MPLPRPYNGVAGAVNDPAESEAQNLFTQYAWVYRLATEMNAEAQLDVKRAFQIALHTRKFRAWYDALQVRAARETLSADPDYPTVRPAGEILDIIRGMFESRKARWPTKAAMVADLVELRTDCGTLYDWMEANQAEYKTAFSTNRVVNAAGDMTDDPIKIAKPAAFATRIATFSAKYA